MGAVLIPFRSAYLTLLCLRVGRSLESLASSHASPLNMGYLMPYSYHNGMAAALTSLPSMVSLHFAGMLMFLFSDMFLSLPNFFLLLPLLLWLFEARNWCFPPVRKKRRGLLSGSFLFRGLFFSSLHGLVKYHPLLLLLVADQIAFLGPKSRKRRRTTIHKEGWKLCSSSWNFFYLKRNQIWICSRKL